MPYQTINPVTNKVIKTFDEMTPAIVDKAVANVISAFATWKKSEYKGRAQLLYKVADLLRERKSWLNL